MNSWSLMKYIVRVEKISFVKFHQINFPKRSFCSWRKMSFCLESGWNFWRGWRKNGVEEIRRKGESESKQTDIRSASDTKLPKYMSLRKKEVLFPKMKSGLYFLLSLTSHYHYTCDARYFSHGWSLCVYPSLTPVLSFFVNLPRTVNHCE